MLLPQAGRAVLLQALSGLVGLLPPHASRTVTFRKSVLSLVLPGSGFHSHGHSSSAATRRPSKPAGLPSWVSFTSPWGN